MKYKTARQDGRQQATGGAPLKVADQATFLMKSGDDERARGIAGISE